MPAQPLMAVNLTDSHVDDGQITIIQAKDSISIEQPTPLQSSPCCWKIYEAAYVDATHLCSAVFYESGPFIPYAAAEF